MKASHTLGLPPASHRALNRTCNRGQSLSAFVMRFLTPVRNWEDPPCKARARCAEVETAYAESIREGDIARESLVRRRRRVIRRREILPKRGYGRLAPPALPSSKVMRLPSPTRGLTTRSYRRRTTESRGMCGTTQTPCVTAHRNLCSNTHLFHSGNWLPYDCLTKSCMVEQWKCGSLFPLRTKCKWSLQAASAQM
jgi:hypothetical protein